VLGYITNVFRKTNVDIIRVSKRDSEVLAMIRYNFHTMLRKWTEKGNEPLKVTNFIEELPMVGVGGVSKHYYLLFSLQPLTFLYRLFLVTLLFSLHTRLIVSMQTIWV
jgi:hypothetical protein